MNNFTWEELFVGKTAEFTANGGGQGIITADMLEKFKDISGDNNPLHTGENFAKEKGFKDRVVYGMLTASLYSYLAGEYLPGKNCLLQSVHADFLNPVFIGDTLTVSGKITEKHDSVRQIIIKAVIRNQDGKKISKAKIEAGVLE